MKKLFLIFFALICIPFAACSGGDDVETGIKKAYFKRYSEELTYDTYEEVYFHGILCQFDDVYVVDVGPRPVTTGMIEECVDGISFIIPWGLPLHVYYDENLYLLQEAFDRDLITHSDLITLSEAFATYSFYFPNT